MLRGLERNRWSGSLLSQKKKKKKSLSHSPQIMIKSETHYGSLAEVDGTFASIDIFRIEKVKKEK